MAEVLNRANRLEGILRKYLNCDYGDFGVKANDNLSTIDWKTPMLFALGCKYGESGRNKELREKIENFRSEILAGQSIGDFVSRFDYFGYKSKEDAMKKVDEIIDEFERLLTA